MVTTRGGSVSPMAKSDPNIARSSSPFFFSSYVHMRDDISIYLLDCFWFDSLLKSLRLDLDYGRSTLNSLKSNQWFSMNVCGFNQKMEFYFRD